MNNFSDFRDLMQRLTRTSDDIKMRIENVGFIPEPGTRPGFNNFEPDLLIDRPLIMVLLIMVNFGSVNGLS